MPIFKPNIPVVQPDPTVTVDATAAAALPVGVNRFRLVVVDDAGNESEPTQISVIVRDTGKPTAILDIVDANGTRISPTVSSGTNFILSGARSSDLAPGKITEYRFTLLDRV